MGLPNYHDALLKSWLKMLLPLFIVSAVSILLQRFHFADFKEPVSYTHLVKLRVVAAGMIAPASARSRRVTRPKLPFTARGRPCTNRAEVVTELMRVVIGRSGAERGTVRLHDLVHGGLQLEGWRGFSQEFADTFSYVSGDDTSCGHAFSDAAQVVVTDVDSSPLFSESAREALLANDVRSCVSLSLIHI